MRAKTNTKPSLGGKSVKKIISLCTFLPYLIPQRRQNPVIEVRPQLLVDAREFRLQRSG